MSDWSSNAAGRFRKKQEDERYKAELELQRHKLLEAGAADLWNELRKQLASKCADFNNEDGMRDTLTCSNADQYKVRIEANRKDNIDVECKPALYTVYVGGMFASTYEIKLVDGTHEVRFIHAGQTFLAHEVAKQIIDTLLGI